MVPGILASSRYCNNPEESFFGIKSVNSRKDGECETPKNGIVKIIELNKSLNLDGRYCHALCKEGYFPPAGYETTAKMTKITCKCNEEEDSCEWEADRPFVGCVGPCEKPIRSFENIELFFKASFREIP